MASFRIKGEIKGLAPLLAELDHVSKKVRTRALRTGVAKAARLLAREAKRKAPVGETGQLKRSIGSKVKTYPSGRVVGIVGPRKGFKVVVDGEPVDPVRYAHLVEMGHGGPAPAPARPFLRPALDAAQSQCKEAIADEVRKALEQGS